SAGFNPANALRRTLASADDPRSDLASGTYTASLAEVNDIRRVEIMRIGETDLLVLRLTLAAPLNYTTLPEGQTLRYVVQLGGLQAWLDVNNDGWTFTPFNAPRSITNGPEVRFDGNTIEMYGVQPASLALAQTVRAW